MSSHVRAISLHEVRPHLPLTTISSSLIRSLLLLFLPLSKMRLQWEDSAKEGFLRDEGSSRLLSSHFLDYAPEKFLAEMLAVDARRDEPFTTDMSLI